MSTVSDADTSSATPDSAPTQTEPQQPADDVQAESEVLSDGDGSDVPTELISDHPLSTDDAPSEQSQNLDDDGGNIPTTLMSKKPSCI